MPDLRDADGSNAHTPRDASVSWNDAEQQADAGPRNAFAELCDGSTNVRLALFSTQPARPAAPGTWILHWFPIMYITGDCYLYVAQDAWADLRRHHLSTQELLDLGMRLNANMWPTLESDYCNGRIDGSGHKYIYGARSTVEHAGTGPYPRWPDWLEQLEVVLSAELRTQYSLGEYFPGRLWYTLLRSTFREELAPNVFHGAELWPLGDPKGFADERTASSSVVRLADGDLAAELRRRRDLWLAGEIGARTAAFIPVLGPDSVKYELRVRAATPFDDDAGALTL